MKLDLLETHDRLSHFVRQNFDIANTVEEITAKEPFGKRSFYIFAHKREIGMDERISLFNQDLMKSSRNFLSFEDVPCARIIWQPRLTKPESQENSMLFKVFPGTDVVRTVWIIPARELWAEYEKDKMTQNELVGQSIQDFKKNKKFLDAPERDDPSEEEARRIYFEIYGDVYIKI